MFPTTFSVFVQYYYIYIFFLALFLISTKDPKENIHLFRNLKLHCDHLAGRESFCLLFGAGEVIC